jgi:pimeloyl-ACP methyl ester carboxylesterase
MTAKKSISLLLSMLTLVACNKPTETVSQQYIMKSCPGFAVTGKAPLVSHAECGELTVKQNPQDENSESISLAILRLPAISPAPAQDPLFLIQGGPGGSSIEIADHLHAFFTDVRKNRDLIFVDQRGTGKSNPLNCEKLSANDLLLSEGEQTKKYLELMTACAEKYREDAIFYTTPYAVKDLDQVRQALGYEKINLWGGSYGTRVALEYARQYPEQTRALVLDGVAPVQIALPLYFARDGMAALNAINAECLADSNCQNEFGDTVKKAEAIVARLQQLQAEGKTLTVSLEHPRHQQLEKITLTAKSFSMMIFMALYSRDISVLLPHAISRAEREDYRLLASLSALAGEKSGLLNISEGMRYSVICNEDWHYINAEDIAKAQPFLGMNFLQEMAPICHLWPKALVEESYWQTIASSTPALLMSGNHDPVTPSSWAKQVAMSLPNAIQIEATGGNHIISTEGCVPQLIAQFIEAGDAKNIKRDCVDTIKPLPIVLGANKKTEPEKKEKENP